MRVLGVDPGFGRCGVAIVEKKGGKEVLIDSACIETPATAAFPIRMSAVATECARLIKKHRPDAVALEQLFFNTNQKTALRVAETRGAIIYVATEAEVPVFEYTPGQVKSATASSGNADKKQVARMLHVLLKIIKTIRHDDECDAIAVALTHLASTR